MKITFVLPPFSKNPVGGYRVVYEYANCLVKRGHEVTVVHPAIFTSSRSALLRRLYLWSRRRAGEIRRVFAAPRPWWQPLDGRVRLLRVRNASAKYIPDADVVFATAWQTAEYIVQYPRLKGHKFYLIMDFAPWLGPAERLRETWRWPFKKVTISRWLYDMVCEAGGLIDDVTNVPIAVDHHRFRLVKDIVPRPKRIAMMYGSSGYKAPEDGLRALELAKAKHSDLEVVVFGSHARPRLVPSSFVYRRNVSEIELVKIYNASRLFVCSSVAEGFALPPAEAMACGCAVVSTDCGGIREYAEHEVNALLSAPSDTAALAQSIIRLLDDDFLRRRLAVSGQQRMRDFTWERSTDLLEDFVQNSLSRRRDA